MNDQFDDFRARRLMQAGVSLFLIGLLTGFAVPMLATPRMALASHIEALMNGMFLVLIGLLWPKLELSSARLTATFWLALYGTFANWAATLLAAAWGAGSPMMPLAAGSHTGSALQEGILKALLVTLSLAMVAVCVLLLAGLSRRSRAAQ